MTLAPHHLKSSRQSLQEDFYTMPTFKKPRRKASRAECAIWYTVLCLIGIVSIITPLYNRIEPEWSGIPFFLLFQFCWIILGAVTTWAAYLRGA